MPGLKLRLQLSVAFGFTLLVALVLGVATGAFYLYNRALAIETAQIAMIDARMETNLALIDIIDPVHRAIAVTTAVAAAFPDTSINRRALHIVDTQVRGLDQISGAYVGYERHGQFFQVARILPDEKVFGEARKPVPLKGARVLRLLEDDGTKRREKLIFLSTSGTELETADGPAVYDPRTRPWYLAAAQSEAAVFSAIYTFSGSGLPGITLA